MLLKFEKPLYKKRIKQYIQYIQLHPEYCKSTNCQRKIKKGIYPVFNWEKAID